MRAAFIPLTLQALALFVAIDLGLRLFGLERVCRWLARSGAQREAGPCAADHVCARSTFAAVQSATRFYYRRRKDCLPKALTTFRLLRRQNVPATLVFGVKKFPFAAHTWIECEGEVLDDFPPRVAAYTPIKRIA